MPHPHDDPYWTSRDWAPRNPPRKSDIWTARFIILVCLLVFASGLFAGTKLPRQQIVIVEVPVSHDPAPLMPLLRVAPAPNKAQWT